MSTPPPPSALDAIDGGFGRVTRRVEITEQDGETPYYPEGDPDSPIYATAGGVSVSSSATERRVLSNLVIASDAPLRIGEDHFWYDKVVKVFRGLEYEPRRSTPRISIYSAASEAAAFDAQKIFSRLGYSWVDVSLYDTLNNLNEHDIIVGYAPTGILTKTSDFQTAYDNGKSVITISAQATSAHVPLLDTVIAAAPAILGIDPTGTDSPLFGTYSIEAAPSATVTVPASTTASAIPVAAYLVGGVRRPTVVLQRNETGGKWLHIHLPSLGPEALKLLRAGVKWLYGYTSVMSWETQIGEFMVDGAKEKDFPRTIEVSGRDYTSKCMASRITSAMSFPEGTLLRDFVVALADNSGITKFKIPPIVAVTGSVVTVDRGTERWNIMSEAANALNHDLYFDEEGFLVMEPYSDPSLSITVADFQTGADGNMASFEKSINSSRIYNHVVVFGDPGEGENRLPFFGEAINTNPNSPTNIDEIGDRTYTYASTFFTSDEQCQAYAETLLQHNSLETYELNFTSIAYPWLTAGKVANVFMPDQLSGVPTRFLLDSIDLSMALGPMSLSGKRVVITG